MMRPDLLIFGYREFVIENEDLKRTIKIFLRNKISVKFNANRFIVSEWKARKIKTLLDTRVRFSMSEMRGMGGYVYKNRTRVGVICALVISMLLAILSPSLVWDVRVVGELSEKENEIIEELDEAGLSVGKLWCFIDKSEVEVKLLKDSELVSWININRRGGVAYVSVTEKEINPLPPKKEGYSNVVATCDAVIEEIRVGKGVARVKVGDSVKKGDLLISGILPAEAGGGFCYAEGVVIGRVTDKISVKSTTEITEKREKLREKNKITLKIFDFSLNIFKSYRNFADECVIIEENESHISIGDVKLPLSLVKSYAVVYEEAKIKLSADELVMLACEKMTDALSSRLNEGTLLRIRTEGEFVADGYVMTSYIVLSESICNDSRFWVNEQ